MKVSFFKNLKTTIPEFNINLNDILDDIRNGKWEKEVMLCREDLKMKDLLPCFTPTGIFEHRSIKGMMHYNGNFCLDLDKLDDPSFIKEKCKQIEWVYAAFITPSGKGLKVIISSNTTKEHFKEREENLADIFLRLTGIQRDNNCKDIARIQFVSFDPELYLNTNAKLF